MEEFLCFDDSGICKRYLFILLFYGEVLILCQPQDELIRLFVHICRFCALTRNDERRSGLINQNRVDLVDDRIIEFSLYELLFICDHVISQIIKTELVVGSICDIASVRVISLFIRYAVNDTSDCEAEERVNFAHPLRVTLGQIIVDRDDMHALSGKSVQVYRKRSHKSLTFTCLHLGYPALMQYDTADYLYSERFHAYAPQSCLTAYGKGLRKQIIQRLAVIKSLPELICLSAQFFIRELRRPIFESIYLICDLLYFLDFFFIQISKDLLQ